MVRCLEEIVAQNEQAADIQQCAEIILCVQQGGSSFEFYVYGFDCDEDVKNYRASCDTEGGYRTYESCTMKPSVYHEPTEQWLYTEADVMAVIQDVLNTIDQV